MPRAERAERDVQARVSAVELVKVTKFKAGVSQDITSRLRHGEVITQIFKQDRNEPRSTETEIMLLHALRRGILESLPNNEIDFFKNNIFRYAEKNYPAVVKELTKTRALSEGVRKGLNKCYSVFFKEMISATYPKASALFKTGGEDND